MTDAQAQKFIAALDKIDIALLAIRMEFEEQIRISNERLAALRSRDATVTVAAAYERREARPA